MTGLEVILLLIYAVLLIMFVVMFVMIMKIWNFQKEILRTGGYPTVSHARNKQEALSILGGTPVLSPNKVGELINALSLHEDDPEAADLVHRLKEQKQKAGE